MTGVPHTEPEGTEFGLKVMQYLNDACAKWKAQEHIDFSLYGTPMESTTYKFAKCLQDRFGINSIPSTYQMVKNSSTKAALRLTAQLKKEDQITANSRNDLDSYLSYVKEEESKIKKAEDEKNGVRSSSIFSKFSKWNS